MQKFNYVSHTNTPIFSKSCGNWHFCCYEKVNVKTLTRTENAAVRSLYSR